MPKLRLNVTEHIYHSKTVDIPDDEWEEIKNLDDDDFAEWCGQFMDIHHTVQDTEWEDGDYSTVT